MAFTTIPAKDYTHVGRERCCEKSPKTVYDLKDVFISKIPDYKENIEQFGDMLDLYEIHFNKVTVIKDMKI